MLSRHRAHLFSSVYLSLPLSFFSLPSRGFKHGRLGDWELLLRSIPVGEINSNLNGSQRKVLICMCLSVNQRLRQSSSNCRCAVKQNYLLILSASSLSFVWFLGLCKCVYLLGGTMCLGVHVPLKCFLFFF